MKTTYKTQILQGHSRPIKHIKFSSNGTAVYSASADRNVIKWDYQKNEKTFTFPHQASVNVICVTSNDSFMFTGDSTGTVYIWELNTNTLKEKVEFDPSLNVRSIELASDDSLIIITFANRAKESKSFINSYSLSKEGELTLAKVFNCSNGNTKYVQSKFTNFNKSILASREDGYLEMINYDNGKVISSNKFHNDVILDFDINYDHGLVLTSSKDGFMSVINLNTFEILRQFHPVNPVRNLNACRIAVINNPYYANGNSGVINLDNLFDLNDDFFSVGSNVRFGKNKEIILAIVSGGQDNKFVTTTNQKEGGFDIIVYNSMNGEQLASFLDHFGPVNSLSVNGKLLASGAEDATVRLHKLEVYLFPNS